MMKGWTFTLLAMMLVCSAIAKDNLVRVKLFYNEKGEITVPDMASHIRKGFIDSARRVFVGKVDEFDMNENRILELTYDGDGKKQGKVTYIFDGVKMKNEFKDDVPLKAMHESLLELLSKKEQFTVSAYIKKKDYPFLRGILLRGVVVEDRSDTVVYTVVDQMPEFPGGLKMAMYFIATNITYPVQAHRNRVTGKVYVEFVIGTDGSVENPRVIRGIGAGCDEAAILAVKSLPDWKPGMRQGKPARVRYALPVNFGGVSDEGVSPKGK